VILISHNMPHVFEVSDRIHIHRLGKRVAVVTPRSHSMSEAVAIMTGAVQSGMTDEEMARPAAQLAA
jgi:fructose transport system ATP-binding protein